jgi:hypothetical protein
MAPDPDYLEGGAQLLPRTDLPGCCSLPPSTRGGLQGGEPRQERKVERQCIGGKMRPPVAVWAHGDHFCRMIRSFIRPPIRMVSFKERLSTIVDGTARGIHTLHSGHSRELGRTFGSQRQP